MELLIPLQTDLPANGKADDERKQKDKDCWKNPGTNRKVMCPEILAD